MYMVLYLHIECTYQKRRASDLTINDCEPPSGCCELNSGPLEDLTMSLTAEPSLEPHFLSVPFKFQ